MPVVWPSPSISVCSPSSAEGEWIGTVVTFADISERESQKERLLAARREAESANRAKTEFLANMSHEIRTPLAAIMAVVDLMQLATPSSQDKAHVAVIHRNARALLDIVNDILDLSKVEADQLEVVTEKFSLPELMADIQSAMGVRAKDKGLELQFRCVTRVPTIVDLTACDCGRSS